MEDRIIELETRLAFQEQTLRDLDDVITRQQRQIDQLEQRMKVVKQQLNNTAVQGADMNAVELPPHY